MTKPPLGCWLTAIIVISAPACTGTILDPGVGADNPGEESTSDGGSEETPVDAGASPGDPDASPPAARLPAAGIDLRDISLFQSVEVLIMEDGTAISQRNAPVVAGADGMIVARFDIQPGWQARQIVAELVIDTGSSTEEYEVTRSVSASSAATITTGFVFEVDGDDFTTAARYSISLYESGQVEISGSTDGARFPASGDAPLSARSSNGPLNLVLVPFQYEADGSSRLPPLSTATVQQFHDRFLAMYPVPEVIVTVREAVVYNSSIGATTGWSGWLDTLTDLRQQDNPPANTFYYGVASPDDSFSDYCRGGCITGLGWVPGADTDYLRASVGVSFPDALNVYTSLHEVGHTMGRSHAPCGGPSGVDPSYPYSGASIGVWGYDVVGDTLKDPNVYTDIMGYCQDQWISDYTYEEIFDRISYANQQSAASVSAPTRYRVGLVDGDGNIEWRRYTDLRRPLVGDELSIALLDQNGGEIELVQGHFFPYDHLDGGMLMVPVRAGTIPAQIRPAGLQTLTW